MKNFDLEKRLSLGHQATHTRDHLTLILFGKLQLKIVKTLMILINALMEELLTKATKKDKTVQSRMNIPAST